MKEKISAGGITEDVSIFESENEETLALDKQVAINITGRGRLINDLIKKMDHTSLDIPVHLSPNHGLFEKPDEVYMDDNGKFCKKYVDSDGGYQIEKSSMFSSELEQYDADGNLVARRKGDTTTYYNEDGSVAKVVEGNSVIGESKVTLYDENGNIKSETKRDIDVATMTHTTEKKKYNEDGSYTVTKSSSYHGASGTGEPTVTVQHFDKDGNPISEPETKETADTESIIENLLRDNKPDWIL